MRSWRTVQCIFSIAFSVQLCAQNGAFTKEDTARFAELNAQFQELVYTQPDSALAVMDVYMKLANKIEGSFFIAAGNGLQGQAWRVKGHPEKAMPHFLRALELHTASNRTSHKAWMHSNVAGILKEQHQWAKAKREYLNAIAGFEATGQSIWAAGARIDISDVLIALGQEDSARTCLSEAIPVLEKAGIADHASDATMIQAGLLFQNGKENEALALFKSKEKEVDVHSANIDGCDILLSLGRHYTQLGLYQRADEVLKKAMHIAITGGFDNERLELHQAMGELAQLTDDPDSALFHLHAYIQLKDSIGSKHVNAEIARLQEQYDSARKDAELEHKEAMIARQRTQLVLAIAMGSVLLVVSVLLIGKRMREKRNAALLRTKNDAISEALRDKELLLQELHHRVKNNLQTVGGLLRMQARNITDPTALAAVRESQDRVRSMALIHQQLQLGDDPRTIEMSAYVERLVSGLMRSYSLDSERVGLQVLVPQLYLDMDTALPIGLILNELVVNALKHAFPEGRTGNLAVILRTNGNELDLSVCDDGIGWNRVNEQAIENSGSGMDMVKAFAEKLNATYTITSESGTQFRMVIKNFQRMNHGANAYSDR